MADSSSKHVTLTIEITSDQKRRIDHLADQKGISPEAVVLEALDREFGSSGDPTEKIQPGSFLDGIEHLVGSVEGPSDLSTSSKHMQGYGRS